MIDKETGTQREVIPANMPSYKSHKTVRALEISAIGDLLHGYRSLAFCEAGFAGKTVPENMFSRYTPVPGDFYVVYDDGYQSFSPRKAFVEGYQREVE